MKKIIFLVLLTFNCLVILAQVPQGAWKRELDSAVQMLTIVDNYFVVTTYNVKEKKFIQTRGGTAAFEGSSMRGIIEFNNLNKTEVKSSYVYDFKVRSNRLHLPMDAVKQDWERIDAADAALSGNWRITGRMQDDKMTTINTGPRKTIKTMSATRFQWTAINTDTGEFFGTGGGTYVFKDGKYTENIEFFSRDASRVGATLSFDALIKEGNWHHSGKSSKGDPIHEVWSRK